MEKRSTEKVQTDSFEILLQEIIQRQEQNVKSINDLVQAVNTQNGKLELLDRNMKAHQDVSYDINSIKEVLKKGITDLKLIVSAYPKSTTKKFQILLFPEQDARLFYKIVFGGWFLMILIALSLLLTYKVITQSQKIKGQIEMEAQNNNPFIKAWNYLYSKKIKQCTNQWIALWRIPGSFPIENLQRLPLKISVMEGKEK